MNFRLSRLLSVWALVLTGCSTLPPVSQAVGPPETVMTIQDKRLDEISGMACSSRVPGVLWVHNDSGDDPRLFAVGPDGKTLGILEITNAHARDWEEMSRFEWEGEPWLLIADVGDNDAVRHDLVIYLLPGPDPARFEHETTIRVPASAVLPFRYEDGPRDCEGVAVDVPNQQILLISKRTEPPVLYTLPLILSRDDDEPPLVAQKSRPMLGIKPPTTAERALPGRLGKYRSWVTAFDISPDDRSAAVLTYGNIYLYQRDEDATWIDTLAGTPERIPFQDLPQAESICFDEGGATLLVSTEDNRPPVIRFRLR